MLDLCLWNILIETSLNFVFIEIFGCRIKNLIIKQLKMEGAK